MQSELKAYVTDFGISRYLGIDYQEYLNSFTSQIRGTFSYIAPECFKKNKEGKYPKATFKSDIWALGALLAELFLQDELYDDFNEMMVCKIVGEMPSCFSKIPMAFQDILKRCLGVKPQERPTANELSVCFQNNVIATFSRTSSITKKMAPTTVAPTGSSRVASFKSFFKKITLKGTLKEPSKSSQKYKSDLAVSEMPSSVYLFNTNHVQPEVNELHNSAFWENLKKDEFYKREPEALSENQDLSNDKINFTFDWQKSVLSCHF